MARAPGERPLAVGTAEGGLFRLQVFTSRSIISDYLTPGGAMKVADLIQSRKEIFSITDDCTVYDAARYLREKHVRTVGVCDRQGKLVGVLSQSDISAKVTAENKCPAWVRVSEIMSTDLIVVPPHTPLDECLHLMEKHDIYHILIMDESAGYRGTISVKDLLRVIASDQKARADMLESFLFTQR